MVRRSDDVRRRDILKAISTIGTIGITGLAGCTGSGGGGGGGSNGSGGGESGLGRVHVGVVNPFSGVYSNLGNAELQGAKLAVQDLQEEFDIEVDITTADTAADPDTGVRRIEEVVVQENVDVVMGGVSSSVAIAMGQWASRNNVAFIASGSHSDATTGGDCAKYMWRTPSSNTMLARTAGAAMADYADSWTLVYADYTWGQTARDAVSQVLKSKGVDVVDAIAVPLGANDYTAALSKVQNSGAEALGNITAGADTTRLSQQYLDSGIANQVKMGGVLFESDNFYALGPEGAAQMGVWGTVWAPSIQSGQMGEFVGRVAKEYDRTAFSRHYLGYTSMDQLVRAAIRAGSIEASDIRGQLEGHDYSDVGLLDETEKWRDCDHQNIKPTYAVQAKPVEEMTDKAGERIWFEKVSERPGSEVIRPCDATGCTL